jgi:hypothetical protein
MGAGERPAKHTASPHSLQRLSLPGSLRAVNGEYQGRLFLQRRHQLTKYTFKGILRHVDGSVWGRVQR